MASEVVMIPAYYLLHYSADTNIRRRRYEKFILSHYGKVLLHHEWWSDKKSLLLTIQDFRSRSIKTGFKIAHSVLMTMSNSEAQEMISLFDEVILFFNPDETSLSGHIETLHQFRHKIRGMIEFEEPFDEARFLSRFPVWLRERLSFHPIGNNLTCKKIFETGQKICSQFPEIKFHPPPDLDNWDYRIPDEVELVVKGQKRIHHQTTRQDLCVSIIIPTYNNKDFLLNCLRHLISQDMDRSQYEIIVVDDGSIDQDLTKLEVFLHPEAGNLNLSYFYVPKKTPRDNYFGHFRAGQCRNFGFAQSRAPIVSFLDSDMIVPKDYLQRVKSSLERADIVQFVRHHIRPVQSTSFTNYHSVLQKFLFIEESRYWRPFFEASNWMELPDYWKYTCTYSLSMSRNSFERWGGFRKTYVSYGFEDTDFGYAAARAGARFLLEKTPLYHLTPFADKSRYRHSLIYKHQLLKLTAKTFYLNHLSPDLYQKFRFFLDK